MPISIITNEDTMATHELAVQTADMNIRSTSWLDSATLVSKVESLKNTCIGNCRLLYGSERFKFYDVVICTDEATKSYGAVLVCNQEGQTKLLRIVSSQCPVDAVHQLVEGLQKDTAKLFGKYTVGSQLDGQQGFTNKETGEFELWDSATDKRVQGPDDDTSGLVKSWNGALGRRGAKRRAVEQMDQGAVQMDRGVVRNDRGYMEGDVLDYGET